ncbi:hypothetical protein G7Y89_g1240 [Cudoniella acicularis]|uniref:2-dehydropantoate 2-reductase n=1 Tax=Cudoniella acicularis TaxID=354080 RepID=A0A8H4RYJ0_9HELO|nr:hypothetical protein G7Y89_g1240 [Cudoniella acicularis]
MIIEIITLREGFQVIRDGFPVKVFELPHSIPAFIVVFLDFVVQGTFSCVETNLKFVKRRLVPYAFQHSPEVVLAMRDQGWMTKMPRVMKPSSKQPFLVKTFKSPSAAISRQIREVSRRFAASFAARKPTTAHLHSGGRLEMKSWFWGAIGGRADSPSLIFTQQRIERQHTLTVADVRDEMLERSAVDENAMFRMRRVSSTRSIGATYAFLFSRAIPASNIVTVCRSNFEFVSQNGFTINSSLWGEGQRVQPVVVRSVDEAAAVDPESHFDYVLVCSKALPTVPSTAELIKPAVSPKTTIVLVQNGIAIEEPYSKLFPDNPLLSTVVYLPATQISPGVIQHKEIELLHIGSYPATSNTESASRFANLLKETGASTQVHEDIQFERWSKLLVNAAWNPICALSRSRDVQVLKSSPEAKDFVRGVMLEIAAAANACGYSGIDTALIDFQLARSTVRELPGVQPSMLADALAGRIMEVEAIVGNVFRLAREHGVETPMLRTIYVLATALNGGFGYS